MTDYTPLRHYGYAPGRPGYTLCGKDKTYVGITFFPEKVTCRACVEELRHMEFMDSASGRIFSGAEAVTR
jgi:hypothetical protein